MKKILSFAITFALVAGTMILPLGQANAEGQALLIKIGQKNDPNQVKEIKQRLIEAGLYNKKVTGYYDSYTKLAVIHFQQKYHLHFVDGIVGPETRAKLADVTKNRFHLSKEEIDLMARAVYSEARGEPFKGQVAVAAVILNRVKSDEFPHTIKGIIYQNGAFTAVADGQINLKPNRTAYEAVEQAIRGSDPTGGAIYYYNPDTATSTWMKERASRSKTIRIGHHIFMK
jgi:N-acetylmuramoyl-L-alanine amidase